MYTYEKRESEGKASIEEKIVKLMDLVHYFVSEHNFEVLFTAKANPSNTRIE